MSSGSSVDIVVHSGTNAFSSSGHTAGYHLHTVKFNHFMLYYDVNALLLCLTVTYLYIYIYIYIYIPTCVSRNYQSGPELLLR